MSKFLYARPPLKIPRCATACSDTEPMRGGSYSTFGGEQLNELIGLFSINKEIFLFTIGQSRLSCDELVTVEEPSYE